MWLLFLLLAAAQSSPFFEQIAANSQQLLSVRAITMGQTANNRPLTVYLITSKVNFTEVAELHGRNAVLVDSYMHAREPYSLQYLEELSKSVLQKGASNEIDYFLSNGILILFPFVNPDGYAQYLKGDLEVRKNMNTKESFCSSGGKAGVDINRNFPSSFGTLPTSGFPCSQEYHGKDPFSENEAKVFKELFEKFRIVVAIDVHSYGNQWIYPYASDRTGLKVQQHRLFPFYESIKRQFDDRKREVKSCFESLGYLADGVYIDWALDQGALSFAFEVGTTFAEDPQEQISKDIQKGIKDFYLILQRTAPKFKVKTEANSIKLISQSLVNLHLTIQLQNRTEEAKLKPGESLEVPIDLNDTYAIITNLATSKQQTVSLKMRGGISLSPFSMVCILLVLLSALLLSFYRRWQALKRLDARIQEVSVLQAVSGEQMPPLSE